MKRLIILLLIIISTTTFGQLKGIRGKVVNYSDGSPLYLANVTVENSDVGTITDKNGVFIIKENISPDDIIKISYVGYETKHIMAVTMDTSQVRATRVIRLKSKLISSQTVLVKGSIGKKGETPITFTKVDREEIENNYINQDIPEYISYLPSTTFYSENGNGLGYNYLSIRGFDQRRISVSINGIPQNDPEDHNVYWLDFPDLLASTQLIQVQRGAGSGVIGYPAVGGSINLITSVFSDKPRLKLSSSIGSYNTRKYSASFSSGLIDQKYSIYAKLSQTLSSGYRNSSWIDFKSFHLSAIRYDENLTTQLNIYGGPVADGLAYTGLPKFAVKDKELRKENYSYWSTSNGQYSYKLRRRPDEIENFSQPHFELLNEFNVSDNVTINSALFLILGNGFFDYDGSWADTSYFRLTQANGFNPTSNPQNVLIRAQVENKQWGWIPRISIKHTNGDLILGGELRIHRSVHWGSLNYGENLPAGVTKDYRYYYYEGGKNIYSFYAHENYKLNNRINLLGELQLAYHNYKLFNERYLHNDFEIDGLYLNPRIGINYKYSPELSSYFAFARVKREPRLKNYYDAAESSGGETPQFQTNPDGSYDFSNPLVQPETMNDFELGFSFNQDDLSLNLNFYYMLFDDEIVKNGQVDRFGQPVTGNIEQTIHRGIELSGTYIVDENLSVTANASYSKNYISTGKTFIEYNDPNSGTDKTLELDLSGNQISGFPNVTFNGIIKYNNSGFLVQLFLKYVGSFYSDNYDENLSSYLNNYPGFVDYSQNKVDAYFTANLISSYEFALSPVFKKVKVYAKVNNLFDNLYAAYAIGKEYFPAAERNFVAGLEIGL